MYNLNMLSIVLILIAFFVFYNEFNKKLNIAEMLLLAIAFIAILRASYNYILIDNLNKNNNYEGFTTKNNRQKRRNNFKNINKTNNNTNNDNFEDTDTSNNVEDTSNDMIINSEDSEDYFDNEENDITNITNNFNNINNTKKNTIEKLANTNKINSDAVSTIDDLLGKNNQEFFYDTPTPTSNPTPTLQEIKDEIKSIFSPKIVIGKNNNGFGNTEKESKWNSAFGGSEFDIYGRNKDCINDPTYTDKKKCAQYDGIRENEDGSLIVQDYKNAKTWVPGYTYLPPTNWDVPQKRSPVCLSPSPNAIKLTGLIDRGLPMNVLELNPQGQVADTEESVQLTNVGSLLPKFSYEEQPFSKPYV